MKTIFSYIVILISLFFFSESAFAQHVVKRKEVLFGFGMSAYKGDLGKPYREGSPIYSIGIKLNRDKRLNGNFQMAFGQISGQELDIAFEGTQSNKTPNNYFNNHFFSLNYEFQFNIIDKPTFKLYLSQGIGIIRHNPKDDKDTELINQTSTRSQEESYGNISLMLPTQLGAKYILKNEFGLGIQTGFMNTLTDYLDNISIYGAKKGNDNIWVTRFLLSVPL